MCTSRTQRPTFPDRTVIVTDYGAIGDGQTDSTPAFRAAINECADAGGGRVVVPPGIFVTGAIHLRDRIDLHLAAGATLAFSRDPQDYLPVVHTRYEGVELLNYSPFIYAYERTNVAVTGAGVIDGRADDDHWWNWVRRGGREEFGDKARLNDWAERGVPVEKRVFGAGHHLRPQFLQFYRCTNVLVEGVTVTNSPMWTIHPVLCRNVIVQDVVVDSPRGPNNDGCNPESCIDVLIRGCTFNTGDDCIAIKAGKGADGRRINAPCENVLIENCEMRDGHGGVTIGSETTGGIRNVLARDCRMDSPRLARALRIKSNPERGGFVRDIEFRDISCGTVAESVLEIALDYARVDSGSHYPDVRGIRVTGLVARSGPRAWYIAGNAGNPVHDVTLDHCEFAVMAQESITTSVDGLSLEGVTVNGRAVTPEDFLPM
ncbi:glycoside hydrolase family 28 protein [Actinopolymorpha alba]|uniref:glycoside hydrolase family 28 protein n=1 Tax=Actinopolymorpha alba TaxID=533267 RepID=UPI00037DAB2D|nr:glycoside hydrolase family 28 protein [Actinopolymorpha alba]